MGGNVERDVDGHRKGDRGAETVSGSNKFCATGLGMEAWKGNGVEVCEDG